METREFIDFICPEHSRTSCSDDDINNGFCFEDDDETINAYYSYRCKRCALLQIESGTIKRTEANKRIIEEKFWF